MKILKDLKNDLLKRRELKLVVTSDKTPNYQDSIKQIAEQFKSKEENIVIKDMNGKFGRKTFLINVFIYDSKEDKEKTETKTKKQRKAEAESAKTESKEETKEEAAS